MKTVRIKKNLLGLVLVTAMLMLAAPCVALASTPPSVTLGKLTDLTGSGYYSFRNAEATNGLADDGTEVKPTTLTVSVSGAGTIVGLNDQGRRDASKTSLILQVSDASEVQDDLREIAFSGCDTTTKIEVTVSANATSLPEETAYITKVVDGHCYMYVDKKLSWSKAYNAAKAYTYNGMRGYLATFSTDSEYDTLRSRVSTSGGWIGGTLMRYKDGTRKINDESSLAQNSSTFTFLGTAYNDTKAVALPDYYWACGPEAGSAVSIETYSDNEPNAYKHSGSDRPWGDMEDTLGMTLYESCLVANNSGKQEINDITETGYQADGYADGFFVEFGGYDEGRDPGNPDSNKTSTVTWTHTHELQYSAGTNKLTVKCTNDNGYCGIPKDGLTLTIPGTMTVSSKQVVYQGTVEVVGTESERAAWTAAGVDLPTNVSIEYSKTEDGTYAPIKQVRNVGYYKISVTAGGVTVQAAFEVFPASCVVWYPKVKDKVYDGTTVGEIDDSATEIKNLLDGDDVHITGTCVFESAGADDDSNKDVTVTNLALTGDDADNYELFDWTVGYDYTTEARIMRRPVELTWSNLSFDYDGQEHVPSCTAGKLVGGDELGVTVSGGQTNAGTWTAKAESLTGTNAANYKLPDENTKEFTIVGSSISPEVSIAGWTYGDEASTPTVTGNPGGGAVTYEYSVKGKENWSADVPTNAGEYTVRATVAAAGNYQGGTATADFTISPRVASLDWGSTELVYNGSDQAPTCAVSNKVEGDDVAVKVTGAKRDAGTGYTATATSLEGAAAGNYALPSTGVTKSFAISPLTVELAWDDTQFTYNGSEQAPTCSVTNAVGDDKVAVSVTGAKRDAGEGTATASSLTGADKGNYALPSTGLTKGFTIAPLTAELAWGSTEFVYNGKAQAPACSVANALAGDDVKVDVDGAQTDAGDAYTATAQALTGAAKGNYALPEQKTTTFSIARAAITPAVSIKGWAYGDAASVPSVDEDGNPGGGAVTYQYREKGEESWSEDAPAAVGEYTVKATVAETGNYEGGAATADFAIVQREVTLTWDETPLVYNGSAQVPSCVLGNTVEGDAASIVVSGAQTDAGEGYQATVSLDGENKDSYVLPEDASKSFSIEKAPISPTVSIEGWTYGDEPGTPSVAGNTGEGAVTYEYSVAGKDDWSTEAPAAAGEYTVKATIVATANYKGAVATADFTVAPKSIEGAEVVLGPGLTENGKEQEQTVESVTLTDGTVLVAGDFAVSGNRVTDAGTYKLTVTGSGNYTGTVEVEFTVAANPDVKPDDKPDGKSDSDEGKSDKGDADKKGSGKKDSRKKIPGTGDDSAAVATAFIAAGATVTAIGAALRRRTAA